MKQTFLCGKQNWNLQKDMYNCVIVALLGFQNVFPMQCFMIITEPLLIDFSTDLEYSI